MKKKTKDKDEYLLPGDKPWPYFWTWLDEKHPRVSIAVWLTIFAANIAAICISIIAIISKGR